MPVPARFYGLVIKMYFQQAGHNPPHIHVLYGNQFMGAVEIRTRAMTEGDLLPRALAMAAEWTGRHEEALLEMWNTREFKKLPPLE